MGRKFSRRPFKAKITYKQKRRTEEESKPELPSRKGSDKDRYGYVSNTSLFKCNY